MTNMMITTTDLQPATDRTLRRMHAEGRFLSDYAALLLRSGATCARLEKNVSRIAATWNVRSDITIMPRHINLSLTNSDDFSETFMATIGKTCINFDIVTRLSKLSWYIADNNLGIRQASDAFRRIAVTEAANRWWVLIAVSFANAAFCRLFGGDLTAMASVFIATMAGFYIKQLMPVMKMDVRLTFIVCAFVSAVLASADSLFGLGTTPDIALATSVLYLIPGIPFLNAFSDMIDGHYICFFSRMTDALILTGCLSIGLCAGMSLMRLGMF